MPWSYSKAFAVQYVITLTPLFCINHDQICISKSSLCLCAHSSKVERGTPNDFAYSMSASEGSGIVPALRLMHYFALNIGYGNPTPAKQLEFTRKLIGSKWKARIIWMLCHAEIARFNELHDSIEGISFKVLKQQLADMEENGIVSRTEYEGKVPKVEYSLTAAGKDAYLIVQSLADWCKKYGLIKQRIIIDS